MPESVITVESVSKRFFIRNEKAGDLRERFGALNPWRRRAPDEPGRREFWALKDVSFSVQPGQPVGIVGHNGSGKSTMLKLLTGIMEPTHGSLKVKGRIGALIEVGAGFHPDLTGRENVYLSGSILGLNRREIDSKFDRIVSFAGLERFIDTPVKRYSSGMYMRLGFSVAAHTDPDVLLIDEVLAVGDTLFQRKCIRHLQDFVKQGGTVVFVSHAMPQVAELCQTCVWLDQGQVRFMGETNEAIDHYMALTEEREYEDLKRNHPEEWEILEAERLAVEESLRLTDEETVLNVTQPERERIVLAERTANWKDWGSPQLLSVTLLDADGIPRGRFRAGDVVQVKIRVHLTKPLPDPVFGFAIRRDDGMGMFGTSNYDHDISFAHLGPGIHEISFDMEMLSLNEGSYHGQFRLFAECNSPGWSEKPIFVEENAVSFEVSGGRFANGCMFIPMRWNARVNTTEFQAKSVPSLSAGGQVI